MASRTGEALLLLAEHLQATNQHIQVIMTFRISLIEPCMRSRLLAKRQPTPVLLSDVSAASDERRSFPMQAVKCHLALCASGSEVPMVEARSQLALGKLILQHTHNPQDACEHFARAVRLRYCCICCKAQRIL